MRRTMVLTLIALTAPLTGGCVARTAWSAATLPVKAGSRAVDMATTSQSESDRNYGRKMRKQEEREGRAYRERCRRYRDDPACRGALPR